MPRVGGLPFHENTAVKDIDPFQKQPTPYLDVLKNTPLTSKEIVVTKGAAMGATVQHMVQVIKGNTPSKSNCYIIVSIKSKDPLKRGFSSLAKTKALKKYEEDFFIQCNLYRNANIEGYIEFYMDVYYENQRSDLDNSLKVVLDCLQKVNAFANDNKVTQIHVRKFLDKSNPRVEFWIKKAME